MIGKIVLFFRAEWNIDGNGIKKWHAFIGKVLDKIQTHEKIDGKTMPCNRYLVELESGMIEVFSPLEAAEIIDHDFTKNPSEYAPTAAFIKKQLYLAP